MLQFMREDSDDILLDMGRLQNRRVTVSEHVMAGSVLYVVETCMQIHASSRLFSCVEFNLTGCFLFLYFSFLIACCVDKFKNICIVRSGTHALLIKKCRSCSF